MLSGAVLAAALTLISVWFALLCVTFWKLRNLAPVADREPQIRQYLTLAGMGFSLVAVGALLALHLSWLSPDISQRLGAQTVRVLSLLLFWPTLLGFLLTLAGSGRVRFLGVGTSLLTGIWWFYLAIFAGISMSAPLARHANQFLIPQGYIGWVEIKHGEKDAPVLPIEHGAYRNRIPITGLLKTASSLEEGWAHDEYFYYSDDGSSLRPLKSTGWGLGGTIWGNEVESQGVPGSSETSHREYFFVGSEEQYHRAVANNEPRPFNEARARTER